MAGMWHHPDLYTLTLSPHIGDTASCIVCEDPWIICCRVVLERLLCASFCFLLLTLYVMRIIIVYLSITSGIWGGGGSLSYFIVVLLLLPRCSSISVIANISGDGWRLSSLGLRRRFIKGPSLPLSSPRAKRAPTRDAQRYSNDAGLFLFTIKHTYTDNNPQLNDCNHS